MEKSEIMEQVKADLERKIRQQNRRKMEEWGREKSTRKSCPEVERKDLEVRTSYVYDVHVSVTLISYFLTNRRMFVRK